jgi:pyruvate/2-oxoglutarate/acetoin dehydrogenase E1 component
MGAYHKELCRAMEYVAQDPRTVFMGQAVAVTGTAMTTTLINVPEHKKLELPVAEEMQMGLSTGMALAGLIPITFYGRWNFLLLAVNQLVNHLDKVKQMSGGGFKPNVIIRTGVGSMRPLNPQCQHLGDFTEAFKLMLTNVEVIRLEEPEDVFPAYKKALERMDGMCTLLVEVSDYYNEK